jgi:hypothetical protein
MLPLMSSASKRLPAAFSRRERRDALRDAVFEHLELRLLQPFHEPPAIVGHVHGNKDHVDRDRMRQLNHGANGLDQARRWEASHGRAPFDWVPLPAQRNI